MIFRDKRQKHHPQTPKKFYKYSRRAWDGLVKVWRQQLHLWDSPNQGCDSGKDSCSDLSVTMATSDEKKSVSTETSDSENLDDSLLADDGFSDL